MTITRRQLYAAGEFFGECATRRECGRIVCGGGDSESQQNTTYTDKRNAVQNGVGVSGDGNIVSVTSTDAGAVKAGQAVATRALDSIDKSNALSAGSFDKLLQAADKLFERGESLVGQTQQHVSDAWLQANTDGKGSIDNKTIVTLGLAAAAVVGVMAYRSK